MYTINRAPRDNNNVILTCNECSHTLCVNQFDGRLEALARRPLGPCCNMYATSTAKNR